MRLSIIMTARCNALCAHCSHGYGPRRTDQIATDQILKLMDEAAEIHDEQPLMFFLTGGEPFISFKRLERIVHHGAQLGGEVYCVTNAFWARNDEVTKERLTSLQVAGLTGLSVSASRFHQEFMPLENATRALRIARELGLFTEFKGAVTQPDYQSDGVMGTWKAQIQADLIGIFPVLPYLREGESVDSLQYISVEGLPSQQCPAETVTIDSRGGARSCCTPGPLDEFLSLGHIQQDSLAAIAERFRNSGRQRVLRERGPIYFACGAIGQGLAGRLRTHYAGPCDLCVHIRTDPQLRRVAEEIATEYATRQVSDEWKSTADVSFFSPCRTARDSSES